MFNPNALFGGLLLQNELFLNYVTFLNRTIIYVIFLEIGLNLMGSTQFVLKMCVKSDGYV